MKISHLISKKLDVMNFLNEIALQYPDAISFASGRPREEFLEIANWQRQLDTYVKYISEKEQKSVSRVRAQLAQYGKTAGIINDFIAKQLLNDESIECEADQLLVTNGCQEAMTILLMASLQNKVLLVSEPTYIGIIGLAEILGISLISVSDQDNLVSFDILTRAVDKIKAEGKDIAGLYLIPDFDNPSGETMDVNTRLKIIEFCYNYKISIFEDNPYGLFYFTAEKKPTMYQLDKLGVVFHLGSFAKTMCPTLRLGYILAPKTDFNGVSGKEIINQLTKVKSFVSVNTSQISQAIAGGILIENGFSLSRKLLDCKGFYQQNRDIMLSELGTQFDGSEEISWNHPLGGFFITVKLPFCMDREAVLKCASEYKVLCMPRYYFSIDSKADRYVRFAFSYVTPDKIKQGIAAFASFVNEHIKSQYTK